MTETPRTIRATYHPDRLLGWLTALVWLSLIGAVLGALFGASVAGADLAIGLRIVFGSLAAGVGAALALAATKAALHLLAEIRDAAIWTHNLLGEQAPEQQNGSSASSGRRYSVGQDGQVVTKSP